MRAVNPVRSDVDVHETALTYAQSYVKLRKGDEKQ